MYKLPSPKRIIMWALTYKCNASCEYCYLADYQQPMPDISYNDYKTIATKIINSPWKPDAIWLTGGEPTVLPFFAEIVDILTSAGMKVVINTNSLVKDHNLKNILNAQPSGIIVSVDNNLNEQLESGYNRGIPASKILERIQFISNNKSPNTLLGTAVVLSKYTLDTFDDYISKMIELGVDYVSINPMHGNDSLSLEQYNRFCAKLETYRKNCNILFPSKFYFDLLRETLFSHIDFYAPCPAMQSFYFISPWGYVYPCSNEIWHATDSYVNMLTSDDWFNKAKEIGRNQQLNLSTTSKCFGERCAGCWKLFFDTIFSGELLYQ